MINVPEQMHCVRLTLLQSDKERLIVSVLACLADSSGG